MRFLVDMPLSPQLAEWLNQQGHEAVHAANLGLDRAADTEVMEQARKDGRVVLTADLDYPRLLALAEAKAPGVILFRGGNYSEKEAVNRLEDVLRTVRAEDLPVHIVVVERSRIRRRRLPIRS